MDTAMKILTKVLVGSRLHGLNTDQSDYDYRGIHIHPLITVLSPFKKTPNTTWIEGDEDNTSYELADFCKNATQGNATILEVFFSNEIIETTPAATEMRENWRRFMDTDKFLMASRGYAHNQYNKMQLFDPDKRTAKFAIAYCRVLWQCAVYFETGVFRCQIDEEPLKTFLMDVKTGMKDRHVPKLTELFMELQQRVTDAYANTEYALKPDIDWIEDFIYRTYSNEN
jgi:predicted nucleotidyltransferase